MGKSELTAEELLSTLCDLPLHDQVSVLEDMVKEDGMADVADVLALCMMTVLLGVDGSCSPDLRHRLDTLTERVRQFNEQRFGVKPPKDNH